MKVLSWPFFFLTAPNWSTCFKFLYHCRFPWVYQANVALFKSLQTYHSPVLHPPFPHVYSAESCPCQACDDRLPSDQGLLRLPLGDCRDSSVHCTYPWHLLSPSSHCLCSERQNLAQYLTVVQSLFILQIHAKMKVCSLLCALVCIPSLPLKAARVRWDLVPRKRISWDDKDLTPQRRSITSHNCSKSSISSVHISLTVSGAVWLSAPCQPHNRLSQLQHWILACLEPLGVSKSPSRCSTWLRSQ